MINLTNSNYDPQTNFLCWWVIITEKKIKKSDYQKCNHACIMHVLTAHHSKAHRGIDFEQLVTEEEVRLVKALNFH